jgi:gamma-glutamylcyclotransferase (GGCT)/AIG2-like uncharacterized protein YtfP
MTTDLTFVYGTLRAGQRNAWGMSGAVCIDRNATTAGSMFFAPSASYPMTRFGGAGTVAGEVYDTSAQDPRIRESVDAMELDAGYVLIEVDVVLSDGRTVRCRVYDVPASRAVGKPIPSGNWLDVRPSRCEKCDAINADNVGGPLCRACREWIVTA